MKTKLEKATIFMNEDELNDACDCMYVDNQLRSIKTIKSYKFPVIVFYEPCDDIFRCFQIDYDTIKLKEVVKLLQSSILWSDIRDEYAKEWYELKENIGKIALFSDNGKVWKYGRFYEYREDVTYKFLATTGSSTNRYRFAKLISHDDLAKENK